MKTMQSTENPNAAMYAAEEKRRQELRAQLEREAPARRAAIEEMNAPGLPPTPTQMENDLAMLAAINAPVQDPQAAPSQAPLVPPSRPAAQPARQP
jgi:hypothetical protein